MSESNKSESSILNRIKDFIPGWAIGDILDEEGIICNAFNLVIDSCPESLLLKHTNVWIAINGDTGTDVDGKKILEVFMVNSDLSNKYTKCREVDHATFQKASFSGSTYEATKLTPIYHFDSSLEDNKLKVLPSGIAAQATYVPYFDPSSLANALTNAIFTENEYLPGTIETAMMLQACIDLMRTKISVAAIDDEDDELIAMYNAHIQNMEAQLQREMQRITGKKAE